jgi:hypothetical protein
MNKPTTVTVGLVGCLLMLGGMTTCIVAIVFAFKSTRTWGEVIFTAEAGVTMTFVGFALGYAVGAFQEAAAPSLTLKLRCLQGTSGYQNWGSGAAWTEHWKIGPITIDRSYPEYGKMSVRQPCPLCGGTLELRLVSPETASDEKGRLVLAGAAASALAGIGTFLVNTFVREETNVTTNWIASALGLAAILAAAVGAFNLYCRKGWPGYVTIEGCEVIEGKSKLFSRHELTTV